MKKIPGYGRGPIHLLGVIFCYALVIYAGVKLFSTVSLWIALAFPAGIAIHDFVLFPIYRKANHALTNYQLKRDRQGKPSRRWINHVRVPVVISFLLLLCYFPIILRLVADQRPLNTGLSQDSYLYRWLLVTAALAAGSALAYFMRRR
jgi:ABC-type sugar transport system permease subunit